MEFAPNAQLDGILVQMVFAIQSMIIAGPGYQVEHVRPAIMDML